MADTQSSPRTSNKAKPAASNKPSQQPTQKPTSQPTAQTPDKRPPIPKAKRQSWSWLSKAIVTAAIAIIVGLAVTCVHNVQETLHKRRMPDKGEAEQWKPPLVAELMELKGLRGTRVGVNGENFVPTKGATRVILRKVKPSESRIGDQEVVPTVINSTRLWFTVPDWGLTAFKVEVRTPGGSSVSNEVRAASCACTC
jgi:hypothetical protein